MTAQKFASFSTLRRIGIKHFYAILLFCVIVIVILGLPFQFSIGILGNDFYFEFKHEKVVASKSKKYFLTKTLNRQFFNFFPNFLFWLSKLPVLTTSSKKTFWNFLLQVLFKSYLSSNSNFHDSENFNNDQQEKKFS